MLSTLATLSFKNSLASRINYEHNNVNNNLRVADLFCGVGGFSLGFKKAGIPILLGIDNWQPACKVYSANHTHELISQDISNTKNVVDLLIARNINGIIGGPPCQDFSNAGKRKEGCKASLTTAYATIISCVKPLFFVMENVPRAATSKAYATLKAETQKSGYKIGELMLNAAFCGVPQNRVRFISIGILDGDIEQIRQHITNSLTSTPLTMQAYFKGKLNTKFYYRHPRNYSRRAIYNLAEPSATIRGVNRPIPANYVAHPNDAAKKQLARPLTYVERGMVQSFPAKYKWLGSRTNIEQMIGNAVPPNLGKVIGKGIQFWIKQNSYMLQ